MDDLEDKVWFYCDVCCENYELPEQCVLCPICGIGELETA